MTPSDKTAPRRTSEAALVFLPTYNERENAERICACILDLNLGLDILFLDDNSPDGTGMVLDRLASRYSNVRVIHRPQKSGIGSAHRAGIHWAYDHGYSVFITLDCDFTHPPGYIPDFLARAQDCAVVIGSRYMRKDSLDNWNLYRRTLTRLGHILTQRFLHISYDATGAYRLYRLDRIPRGLFDQAQSKGYSFFFESLHLLHRNKIHILEIPIILPARSRGSSKMAIRDIFHSVTRLLRLYAARNFIPTARTSGAPCPPPISGGKPGLSCGLPIE